MFASFFLLIKNKYFSLLFLINFYFISKLTVNTTYVFFNNIVEREKIANSRGRPLMTSRILNNFWPTPPSLRVLLLLSSQKPWPPPPPKAVTSFANCHEINSQVSLVYILHHTKSLKPSSEGPHCIPMLTISRKPFICESLSGIVIIAWLTVFVVFKKSTACSWEFHSIHWNRLRALSYQSSRDGKMKIQSVSRF